MSQLYRKSSIGEALDDCLDDLVRSQQITNTLKDKVLQQFDKTMAEVLGSHLNNRISFKANCKSYRHVNGVWRFMMRDTHLKVDGVEPLTVPNVRIVAFDSKSLLS
eukprot:m.32830 g.32830  ORF g.32830 m.32830 type:complete len:106 (-) comp5584_c0_seq1:127-444(-)